jgi:hypothetical protein
MTRLLTALTLLLVLAACDAQAALAPSELIDAFVARSQAEDRTFRAEYGAELRVSGTGQANSATTLLAAMEASGDDYRTSIEIRMAAIQDSTRFEVIGVDGETFVLDPSTGRWSRETSAMVLVGAASGSDVFGDVTAAELEYVGPSDLVGEGLHLLSARDPASLAPRILGVPEETMSQVQFVIDPASTIHVYIQADGTPVAIESRVAGETRFEMSEAMPFQWSSSYRFSDWGEPIEIIAPPAP